MCLLTMQEQLSQACLPALSKEGLYVTLGVAWVVAFSYSGFDQVFFIFSVMALVLGPGLGHAGASPYSAYSVFNRGQRHLLGDLRAEQLDAEQRGDQCLAGYGEGHGAEGGLIELPPGVLGSAGGEEDDAAPLVRSRDANRPCRCGSGLKAKRCCFAPRARDSSNTNGCASGGAQVREQAQGLDEPDPLLEQWRGQMQVVATGCRSKGSGK